jgi:hypothetical protein
MSAVRLAAPPRQWRRTTMVLTCVTNVNVARNALLYNAACRHGDWAQAAYLFAHTPGSVCDIDTDY